MLCFLFSALIVALDQFFKHWVSRTLSMGEVGPEIIPGVLGLTLWENDGAMLNILSGQQWLLAAIAFGAAVVLVMILLRYNEGFWGTIGLSAVLGGTIGNLADRIFNDGKVIDMFRTLFIEFPIFNVADIFITLGFLTFLVHFITLSFKTAKNEAANAPQEENASPAAQEDYVYDELPDVDAIVSEQAEQDVSSPPVQYPQESQHSAEAVQLYEQPLPDAPSPPEMPYHETPAVEITDDTSPITETVPDSVYSLDVLEAELDSLDDYNVEDILREYGFEEDD